MERVQAGERGGAWLVRGEERNGGGGFHCRYFGRGGGTGGGDLPTFCKERGDKKVVL